MGPKDSDVTNGNLANSVDPDQEQTEKLGSLGYVSCKVCVN